MQELKICVYEIGSEERIGSVFGDQVYDLNLCSKSQVDTENPSYDASRTASDVVPSNLKEFIGGGASTIALARRILERVLEEGSMETFSGEPVCHSLDDVTLKAPILPSTKVICMAGTFQTHLDGAKHPGHDFPHYFTKMSQVVVGPDEWVVLPKHHADPVVYGSELTLVMGSGGRSIPENQAQEHVWGYTILNDVTLRGRYNPNHKVFDTSAPIGPWIVPKDQIDDPHNVRLGFRINGKEVQVGSTNDLLFSIPSMIAEVSKWLTLYPGDIIATGDVGAKDPLKPGDIMEADVEGIGALRNPVKLEV